MIIFCLLAKDCGIPLRKEIPYGRSAVVDSTTYLAEIKYECDEGFMFRDRKSMSCQADGTWSHLPTCEREYTAYFSTQALGHPMT